MRSTRIENKDWKITKDKNLLTKRKIEKFCLFTRNTHTIHVPHLHGAH